MHHHNVPYMKDLPAPHRYLFLQSESRYNSGKYKQARDAARDAKFTALFAFSLGIAIAFFFLWLYAIVPEFWSLNCYRRDELLIVESSEISKIQLL